MIKHVRRPERSLSFIERQAHSDWASEIHGRVVVRGRSVRVITDLEDVCVLASLAENETELAARLLARALAIRLAQLTTLGADEGLTVLVLNLVPSLTAQGAADGDTDSLTGLLGGTQSGALVAMILGPQVNVVEQTLESLLSAKVGTELHAQGRVGHVGGITLLLLVFVVIVFAYSTRHVAGVLYSQLQTLLSEVDLVLQVLLALHLTVVQLVLTVHHKLGQLKELVDVVFQTLEASTINKNLAISVRGTAGTVGVRGDGLLLGNLLLHSGGSRGLLVEGCQVWIHIVDSPWQRTVMKFRWGLDSSRSREGRDSRQEGWNVRQEGLWPMQNVEGLWVVE